MALRERSRGDVGDVPDAAGRVHGTRWRQTRREPSSRSTEGDAVMPATATPPWPGRAPMPHPQLRVTNQDREQVVEHVKAAYAEGRLDKHEMDERLHLAMTARTHADLVPIMNDLYG